jgi:RimJ/RimL family protein N-acetyltransferase
MVSGDWAAYADMMGSARARFMGGPFGTREAWGMFCHDSAGWALFGMGALMIEKDGTTVGQVGINHGPLFPEPELGWIVFAGHEGQGYATEAARCLRDWAFAQTDTPTLVSYADPNNAASHAVAERLGAIRDKDAPVQDAGDMVYRHRKAA